MKNINEMTVFELAELAHELRLTEQVKTYLQIVERFNSIQKQGIGNIIIDLRNNGGGSELLCRQLMYFLTDRNDLKDFTKMYFLSDFNKQTESKKYKDFIASYTLKNSRRPESGKIYKYGFFDCDSSFFDKIENKKSPYFIPKNRTVFKGKVIVLANYGTGSAAAMLTTLLKDHGIATVIGTSTGNNPIGATTFNLFKLPYSKLTGTVASDYLERPNINQGKIFLPDYWIENNWDDLIEGNDQYFELAMKLINTK